MSGPPGGIGVIRLRVKANPEGIVYIEAAGVPLLEGQGGVWEAEVVVSMPWTADIVWKEPRIGLVWKTPEEGTLEP